MPRGVRPVSYAGHVNHNYIVNQNENSFSNHQHHHHHHHHHRSHERVVNHGYINNTNTISEFTGQYASSSGGYILYYHFFHSHINYHLIFYMQYSFRWFGQRWKHGLIENQISSSISQIQTASTFNRRWLASTLCKGIVVIFLTYSFILF